METSVETKVCKHCKSEIPKGAKVCPNCRKKQGGMLKWLVIAVIAVIIIVNATSGDSSDDKQETPNSVQTEKETKKEPKIKYTKYTVKEMLDDLENNALKAAKKYEDQYIEITGKLGTIDSSGDYISLEPDDDGIYFINVQCYIQDDKQLDAVMEMSEGDEVTLKGKCTSVGEVLGYSLDIDSIK